MCSDSTFLRILEAAKSGDSACKEELIGHITPRIRAYIFRSTLDQHTTDDLLQEVFCKMLESLDSLRDVNAFWGWIYRITSNCINSHYRSQAKYARTVNLQDKLLESVVSDSQPVEAKLVSNELGQAVLEAISTLKPRHRQVVTLRCFEGFSFREISQIEQTSEMYSRVLYHRSIEKLRMALKRQGFSKASLALAITLFGQLTSTSEAAAIATTVSASTVTGVGATKGIAIIGKMIKAAATFSAHKVQLAAATATTAAILFLILSIGTLRSNVKSFHYTHQGVSPVSNPSAGSQSSRPSLPSSSSSQEIGPVRYKSKGAYEAKVYMPDGPDGPVLRFEQRWNMEQTKRACSWLQDGSANYYYHGGEKKIYISNDPLHMLILPSDPPEFVEFIYSQVNHDPRISYKRKFFTDLIISSVDNRVPKYSDYKSKYTYNKLERSDLLSEWPKTDNVVDLRDEMHKRGWTCFEINGQILDKKVTGTGRIPFVYDMYRENLPWLSIQVGDDVYIDYPGNVAVVDSKQGKTVYKNEALFEGLCRPWQGIPTIDLVRRDAAKYRLPFNTQSMKDIYLVTVHIDTAIGPVDMEYEIDKAVDVIRNITFISSGMILGELDFDYIQDASIAKVYNAGIPQTDIAYGKGTQPQNLWLAMLLDKNLKKQTANAAR